MTTTNQNNILAFTNKVRDAFAHQDFHYYHEEMSDFGDIFDSESITYELSENGLINAEIPNEVLFSFEHLQNELSDFLKFYPQYQTYTFEGQLDAFLYHDFI